MVASMTTPVIVVRWIPSGLEGQTWWRTRTFHTVKAELGPSLH